MNIRCAGDGYCGTAAGAGGPVSLYIHIPFCVRKCRYCDFLSGPSDEGTVLRYLEALEREIRAKASWLSSVTACSSLPEADTIFIGGGTPSLLTSRQLDHLMFVLSSCFLIDDDAEITLECNPGTADEEKLRAFGRSGINRLSIGVQSFCDDELRLLGRIHTAEQARTCIENARRAGFTDLNLDLMSALPGQTHAQWMENLAEAVSHGPEHISAYSLILEDGTALKEMEENGALPAFPDEDEDRRMYHDTKTFLAEHGYCRYEISNYARPGFESRHNNGYWTGHPYLGLGLGASSYLILRGGERVRWSGTRDMQTYLRESGETKGILCAAEALSRQDQMAEFMFLGLRRVRGVSERDFAGEFGQTVDEVYGRVVQRWLGLGLLQRSDGYLSLTDAGIDVSNTVMADFLL